MRAAVRLIDPTHPSWLVKSKIIETHGLSVTEVEQALGVTRPALSALLNGRAHLSPEMALRIEKALCVSLDTLMRMQNSFDIAQVRKRAADIEGVRFKPKGIMAGKVGIT